MKKVILIFKVVLIAVILYLVNVLMNFEPAKHTISTSGNDFDVAYDPQLEVENLPELNYLKTAENHWENGRRGTAIEILRYIVDVESSNKQAAKQKLEEYENILKKDDTLHDEKSVA